MSKHRFLIAVVVVFHTLAIFGQSSKAEAAELLYAEVNTSDSSEIRNHQQGDLPEQGPVRLEAGNWTFTEETTLDTEVELHNFATFEILLYKPEVEVSPGGSRNFSGFGSNRTEAIINALRSAVEFVFGNTVKSETESTTTTSAQGSESKFVETTTSSTNGYVYSWDVSTISLEGSGVTVNVVVTIGVPDR